MPLNAGQKAEIYKELERLAATIIKIDAIVWEGFFKRLDQMIEEGKLSEGDKEGLLSLIEEHGITSPQELKGYLIEGDC